MRWALDFKRWPHVRTALVGGFHIPVARRLSGQTKLPVIAFDGEVIAGSRRILEEIERRRPEPPLFPAEPEARRRAAAIEAHFDEAVAPELRRLFWAAYIDDPAAAARMATDGFGAGTRALWRALFPLMRPLLRRNMDLTAPALEAAGARMTGHFDRLAAEIGPSGYLVGDRFGVADLCAAAIMTAIVRPPEFPYPLPEPWPQALVALRASVARHPACEWVLDVYARHRGASCAISG